MVDQKLHSKMDNHRLLLVYKVLVRCFMTPVRRTFQEFADMYEDTHEQQNNYVKSYEMYQELQDDIHDLVHLTHEVSVNGDFATTLRHGDIWESVHFKMRKALDLCLKLTLDFSDSMIDFLLTHDAIKNKEFVINLMHGPKQASYQSSDWGFVCLKGT